MELVYYLPRHHHIYVVFIPVILFGEFGLQSYLSSKVPQVFFNLNGFRATIPLYMHGKLNKYTIFADILFILSIGFYGLS